ncbi:melatonin receptor type 1B-A-like [Mercenaria mercenaria]|uniref:melatonin receptor type 1B-A-like n=1 Tax=Mercenaria mercenaria TaxID=6596 RepID=UPI00234EE1F6|nr:melatonin receptor type 1B-A-like [Mercenaria mercenaria]
MSSEWKTTRFVKNIFIINLAISDMFVTAIANPMSIIVLSIEGNGNIYGRFEFLESKPVLAIASLIFLSIASVVGTFGNIFTLLVMAPRCKTKRNVEYIFIVNLAISDIYVTTFADPISIIAKVEGEEFFNRIPGLCQTIASLCTVSCVTSLMTIGLMSVNRYVFICAHEKYDRIFTKLNCIGMCISLYFVGGLLVLLNAADIGDHGFDRKSLECIWDRMATYPYTVIFSVTLVWIPSIIIGVCYLKIYLYVRAHSKRVADQVQSHSVQPLNSLHLAKTLFLIYAVFITCWVPYALLIVIDADDSFAHELHLYITLFAHLHPSLNWIIYYITNAKFADACKQCFRRIRPCRPNSVTPVVNH